MPKDWTSNLTKKSGTAAQFLKPFGDPKVDSEDNNNVIILTGLYLQDDMAKILDKLAKKGGCGENSRIANDALRKYFSEKGVL